MLDSFRTLQPSSRRNSTRNTTRRGTASLVVISVVTSHTRRNTSSTSTLARWPYCSSRVVRWHSGGPVIEERREARRSSQWFHSHLISIEITTYRLKFQRMPRYSLSTSCILIQRTCLVDNLTFRIFEFLQYNINFLEIQLILYYDLLSVDTKSYSKLCLHTAKC